MKCIYDVVNVIQSGNIMGELNIMEEFMQYKSIFA
jgi:hypothetical protein